jgi:hypothetical protein
VAQVDAVLKLFRIQSIDARLHFVELMVMVVRAYLKQLLVTSAAVISSSLTEDSRQHWQLLFKLHNAVYWQSGVALSLSLSLSLVD